MRSYFLAKKAQSLVRNASSYLIRPGVVGGIHAAISNVEHYSFVSTIILPQNDGPLRSHLASLGDSFSASDMVMEEEILGKTTDVNISTRLGNASFDEDKWKEFISFLNPLIADNLQLRDPKNRDLILFYNYCLFEDKHNSQHNSDRVVRNRSIALGNLPIMGSILERTDEKSQESRKAIDNGKSIEVLQGYFDNAHWATQGFLRRVSHVKSLNEVEKFGRVLSSDLYIDGKGFDEKRYGNRVSDIPHSAKDLDEFKFRLKCAVYLEKTFPKRVATNLFLNTKKWTGASEPNDNHLPRYVLYTPDDYFRHVTEDVFLPAYLRDKDVSREDCDNPEFVDAMVRKLQPVVEVRMTSILDLGRLRGYVNRMERNRAKVNSSKILLTEELHQSGRNTKSSWHPIFADQRVGGVKFKVLTNQEELSEESDRMNNCVKGLAQSCRNSNGHVLSGMSFSLYLSETTSGFRIIQIRGGGKSMPMWEDVIAADLLIKKMNSGEIELNPKRGAIEKDEDIYTRLGFDPFNPDHVKGVMDAYKDARVLPTQIREEDLEGLAKFLRGDAGLVVRGVVSLAPAKATDKDMST